MFENCCIEYNIAHDLSLCCKSIELKKIYPFLCVCVCVCVLNPIGSQGLTSYIMGPEYSSMLTLGEFS